MNATICMHRGADGAVCGLPSFDHAGTPDQLWVAQHCLDHAFVPARPECQTCGGSGWIVLFAGRAAYPSEGDWHEPCPDPSHKEATGDIRRGN